MVEIIDLSYPIMSDMPVYPGTKPPVITEVNSIETDGFKESIITFYSHTGTHLDVPAHLYKKGKALNNFNCSSFFGSAILIDCSKKEIIDYKTVAESYNSSLAADFVIFYTGWEKYWGSQAYFSSFPVLSKEAAKFICTLPLKGLGIDAISFDPVDDPNLFNHKIFMEKDFILIENLCSLEKLSGKKFDFSCLPLNIIGADGSPTRAIAILK